MFCRRFEKKTAVAHAVPPIDLASMPNDPLPPLTLAHGLAFAELYSTTGASVSTACFLAHLREADAPLAARLDAARASPPGPDAQGRVRASDRTGAASRGFPRQAFRHRAGRADTGSGASRVGAALRGQAPVRPAQGDEHASGRRGGNVRRRCAQAGARSCDANPVHRARVRRGG
jgi:hypothetical protein